MWCANCQADVATEISADGQSLKCTTCAHEIRRVFAPSLHPETQSARELLDRWAREDQQQHAVPAAVPPTPVVAPPAPLQANVPAGPPPVPKPKFPVVEKSRGVEQPPATQTPVMQNPVTQPPASQSPVTQSPVTQGPIASVPALPPMAAVPVAATAEPANHAEAGNEPPMLRRGQPEKPFRPPVKIRIDEAHESPAPRKPLSPIPPPRHKTISEAATSQTPLPPQEPSANAATPVISQAGAGSPPVSVEKKSLPAEPARPRLRVDAAHTQEQVPAPHVDIRPFAPRPGGRPGRAESLWGQLLAYGGVGGITMGTVLVVWGYFGGIEAYASTGWLVATAGQMLLLLGVVTLISGGMQQTTHEVGARIETLDGRIHRIERSTHQLLKGPHFSRKKKRSRQRATGLPPEAESA